MLATAPTAPAVPPTASARLEQSRARLRQSLCSRHAPAQHRPPPAWRAALPAVSVLAVAVEAVSSWWMHHPLRVASTLVAGTARAVVQPLARRSPMGLLLGALLVGGLLAWVRPWRWFLKPALFSGLWSPLLSKAIAHLPLESWLVARGAVAWSKPSRPAR